MASALPALTAAQVRAVDSLTAERFGVPVEWLMEAAGWQVARHCRARTAVLAGKGGNGGDALAAARHLHRWGRLHSVACTDRAALAGPAAEEARALEAAGVTIESAPRLDGAQLVLDGLLGTGAQQPPRGRAGEWISALLEAGIRTVSIDVPSGLDSDTGTVHDPCVRAAVTVTLGLPKPGLLVPAAAPVVGELWMVDIGVPFAAYEEVLGRPLPPHLFAVHDRLQPAALAL